MLLRKQSQLVGRKVLIRLPRDTWAALDELEKQAKEAGLEVDASVALAESLTRMIGRSRQLLGATAGRQSKAAKPDVEAAAGITVTDGR